MKPAPPRRAFDLTIHLGGDTWADVVELLRDFAAHVEQHGPECDRVTGGVASGGHIQIFRDPAMTHDAYVAALERWRAARAECGAKEGA